jgi:hypothetical protein
MSSSEGKSPMTPCVEGQSFPPKEKELRHPGIEPGSLPWQGSILPLDQCRVDGDEYTYMSHSLFIRVEEGTFFSPTYL